MERIINICNGNPGALSVFKLISDTYSEYLDNILNKLENNNIKGSDIWIIYKSECNKNIDYFLNHILHGI